MLHESMKETLPLEDDQQSSGSDSDSSTFVPADEKSPLEFVTRSYSQSSAPAPVPEGRRGRLSRNPSKLGILDELSQSSETSFLVASDFDVSSHGEEYDLSVKRGVTVDYGYGDEDNKDHGYGKEVSAKKRGALQRASSQQSLGLKTFASNHETASSKKKAAPSRSKSSGSELLEAASDHAPRRKLPSQSASKKGKMRRRNSNMLSSASSFDLPDECEPPEVPEEDVIESRYKSILKKEGHTSSGNSVNFIMSGKSKRKVLRIINYIEKFDESLRDELWWNEDDLDRRYDQDMDMAILVEARFEKVMRRAFKSTSAKHAKLEGVDFDFKAMASCSLARGMEIEVYPEIRDLKKKHRQAVLAAQDLIRDENGQLSLNDSELKLIRLQSVKYSKPFLLVSLKMAEFDQIEALDEDFNDQYGHLWMIHGKVKN